MPWHSSVITNKQATILLQIQHAGEGGLYAELVQDRSFSGLAYTQVLFHCNEYCSSLTCT